MCSFMCKDFNVGQLNTVYGHFEHSIRPLFVPTHAFLDDFRCFFFLVKINSISGFCYCKLTKRAVMPLPKS